MLRGSMEGEGGIVICVFSIKGSVSSREVRHPLPLIHHHHHHICPSHHHHHHHHHSRTHSHTHHHNSHHLPGQWRERQHHRRVFSPTQERSSLWP